jgi:signal transduction histidine kinase
MVQQMLDTVQHLSSRLRPAILDDFGLEAAIEWQAQEFERWNGTRCRLDLDITSLVPDRDRDTAVFRILQESLTNVARHAEASQVVVRLVRDADGIELSVADDGKGPPPLGPARGANDGPGGIGITSMRERAALMGGRFEAGRGPRGGLHVVVWVPLARPETAPVADPDPAPEGVR